MENTRIPKVIVSYKPRGHRILCPPRRLLDEAEQAYFVTYDRLNDYLRGNTANDLDYNYTFLCH